MSSETVVLKVKMSCSGCSGAVNRVLEKMEGVESFDIDMKEQKVTVKGNVKPQDVFDTVSKTGKKTEFWVEPENNPTETATEAEPENKPSEAVTIDPVEPDNKPSETATVVSIEPENKPSETATVAA
ncbi:putative heavy metal-associated domain, HMA [Medicago truncatula]|uniref:Copper chaperone n=1 Tax=Medicago truncatula TaxID=3880 RepID=B7FJ81_MEDTR|nr:copper transport protein ATX1 [Medicago truncatula]ACJ84810.1 unknown [Medicago truncatula]AES77677.2 copper chaperone [Medicago truncatula]AFK47931.1 unknown [Medicago truncatula]RHN44394.1 putative heavy metal-associated domain, HMA [Medicago truncatula]